MAKKKESKLVARLVKATWIAFVSFILLVILVIVSVRINLFNLFGDLPSYQSMENPEAENDLASLLI